MKLQQIILGLVAFAVGGASAFLITRTLVGSNGGGGGVATREGLVAATVDGVNTGDRTALLEIMVGPASDRVAAICDEESSRDDAARDKRRAERVDDALDEAKRRRLVLDHIGDDHVEVVAKKGDEIDKHCRARVDVVKHDMEIALHDGKSVNYTAQLTAIEFGGQWYLATIPLAVPVGSAPPAPVVAAAPAPPVETPSVAATPSPDAATPPVATPKPPAERRAAKPEQALDATGMQALEIAIKKAPWCATFIKKLRQLRTCKSLPANVQEVLGRNLDSVLGDMPKLEKGLLEVAKVDTDCRDGYRDLLTENFDFHC